MCVVVLSSVALLVVVVVVVVCVIFSVDVCQFSVVVFALPPFCLPAVAVENPFVETNCSARPIRNVCCGVVSHEKAVFPPRFLALSVPVRWGPLQSS
jgi:hypothetical protein